MSTPDRIGPYRLGEPLGAGGMGVVYLAWDERLGRRVAVKHVRPELADEARRQRRLRREARAVAQISHPAVVQVHDIVEADDGDWIVMEYVAGKTLARLLRDGPLPMARVLALGREIAEGLAEAHGKGFLHRDLKVENVLVTSSGHAKILDFGLVKRYWPLGPTPSDTSEADGLLGTRRSMSPEQVRGFELDPRSDLFSLGNLLYETLTGVSPFLGRGPVETLDRVCRHQPAPALECNPEVPAELSALIDGLLEKDRTRRPQSARDVAGRLAEIEQAFTRGSSAALAGPSDSERGPDSVRTRFSLRSTRRRPSAGDEITVPGPEDAVAGNSRPWRRRWPVPVALLAAGLVIIGGFFLLEPSNREPLYVTVPPPELGVGRERDEVGLLAAGVHTALLRGLVGLRRIAVLEPQRGEELPGSPQEAARAMAADEVLASRLDCESESCQFTLRRLQGSDGRLRWVESLDLPTDDFSLLASATIAGVKRVYRGFETRPGVARLDVRGEDYEAYLRLHRIFQNRQEAGVLDHLMTQLEALRRSSPRFLEAYLLEARLGHLKFFRSHTPRDLERTLELLQQAHGLAEDDPRPLIQLFHVFLVTKQRLGEAERIVADLESLMPGDVRLLSMRALLFEGRGEKQRALELMRTVARRRPSSYFLAELAEMEIRLGEVEAARRDLEGLLRRFPQHFQGASMLARLELSSGSAERACELYGKLIEISPGFNELSNLGTAQMLLGRYPQAAASFRQALGVVPTSPIALLNLADAELLQGNRNEAHKYYRRVLEGLREDPVASYWQSQSIKAQALAHLGRAREAVTAAQQALRQAPENPQAAYEAALVYALVGEESSARVHAERALAGGVERRWFSFPWFDTIRQ